MLNLGAPEIIIIMVIALLVLGPQRLPELARGIGKFVRDFRRQTDEVRTVVEREFYRMDQDIQNPPAVRPLPEGTAVTADAQGVDDPAHGAHAGAAPPGQPHDTARRDVELGAESGAQPGTDHGPEHGSEQGEDDHAELREYHASLAQADSAAPAPAQGSAAPSAPSGPPEQHPKTSGESRGTTVTQDPVALEESSRA